MSTAAKTVLITGCRTGIGRASALAAAARGHHVFATARDPAALADLAAADGSGGGSITPLALDVTDAESIRACAERVFALTDGRGPDVLVNNAGLSAPGPVELVPIEGVRTCFETNVIGLLAVSQAFLPAMRRRRAGRIVNVSSLVGRVKVPYEGVYVATKHAVEALSEALRFEVAPFGIEVVVIQPGPLRTEFNDRYDVEHAKVPYGDTGYRPHMDGFLIQRNRAMSKAPGAEAGASVILRAIEAERPPARVLFPPSAHFQALLFAAVPGRLMQALLRAAFRVPRRLAAPAPGAGTGAPDRGDASG